MIGYKNAEYHQKDFSDPLMILRMVGVAGLEPAASWSRTKHATKLRYTPSLEQQINYIIFLPFVNGKRKIQGFSFFIKEPIIEKKLRRKGHERILVQRRHGRR